MCPAILPPPHGSFFFLSSCAAGHGAPSYRAARNGSLARLRALARGPKRHARSTILFLWQAPPPPAGRELLCISSYRAARNGTPAAHGPTQHARSASRSGVQPETARSLRAVLPAGLYLYPICLSSCCLDTSMQTAADVNAKSCRSETAKTPPNISKSQGPLKHAQQLATYFNGITSIRNQPIGAFSCPAENVARTR